MLVAHFLTENDFTQWLPLWQAYLRFYQVETFAKFLNLSDWGFRSVGFQPLFHNFTPSNPPLNASFGVFDGCIPSNQAVMNFQAASKGFVHVVLHLFTWDTRRCCYL